MKHPVKRAVPEQRVPIVTFGRSLSTSMASTVQAAASRPVQPELQDRFRGDANIAVLS
jgi:hypothetical protein